MKIFNKSVLFVLCLHITGTCAFGAEAQPEWRSTYDQVMLIVNFLILFALIYKFGKKPIMNFLKGQKDVVAREIEQLEDQKKDAAEKVEKTMEALEKSEAHFAQMKERIIRMGEKKRSEIIDDAKVQSNSILEMSKRKIGSQINQAKKDIKAELVDSAMAMAEEKLPHIITEEDGEKRVEDFIENALKK